MKKNKITKFISKVGSAFASGFDAVTNTQKRPAVSPIPKRSPDRIAQPYKQQLNATTAYAMNNITSVSWAIRLRNTMLSDFLIYVNTEDENLNEKIMRFWNEWKDEAHLSGRFHFDDLFMLQEIGNIIDGDSIFVLVNGKITLINGSRIKAPSSTWDSKLMEQINKGELIDNRNGLLITPIGEIKYYNVSTITENGKVINQVFSNEQVILDGYYTDGDMQLRGVSPLVPALNLFRDMYDINDQILAKIKLHAMLGLFVAKSPENGYQDALQFGGMGMDEEDVEYIDAPKLSMPQEAGAFIMEGLAGEQPHIIESKVPSSEFLGFSDKLMLLALQSLDIPYSFANSSGSGYPSIKIDANNASRAMQPRTHQRMRICTKILRYVLNYYSSELGLNDVIIESIISRTEWIGQPDLFLDELQQAKASYERESKGFSSKNMECLRLSRRPHKVIAKERAKERELELSLGLPVLDGLPGQQITCNDFVIREGEEQPKENKR